MLRKQFNHSGVNSATYQGIPANSDFFINGVGNVVINGTVGENCHIYKSGVGQLIIKGAYLKNSKLTISGVGDVSLYGTIDENCIITKSGVGKLYIHGAVSASVKLNMSGIGDVIFDQKPPQTMIDNIRRDGTATLRIPGLQAPPPASSSHSYVSNVVAGGGMVSIGGRTFRGNSISVINGVVFIDGQPASNVNLFSPGTIITSSYSAEQESDDDIEDTSQATTFVDDAMIDSKEEETQLQNALKKSLAESKQTIPTDESLNYTSEADLKDFSTRMRTYIQSFNNTKKFSVILDELKLTEKEALKFEKFLDRITENYMDIPVELHEQFFDFSTLNKLKIKRDPFTQEEFTFADIQTARKVVDEFRELIKSVKNERENATIKIKENDLAVNKLKIFSDSEPKSPGLIEPNARKENNMAMGK